MELQNFLLNKIYFYMDKWETRKSYVDWLSDSELREEFSKKITFENLSLWW